MHVNGPVGEGGPQVGCARREREREGEGELGSAQLWFSCFAISLTRKLERKIKGENKIN